MELIIQHTWKKKQKWVIDQGIEFMTLDSIETRKPNHMIINNLFNSYKNDNQFIWDHTKDRDSDNLKPSCLLIRHQKETKTYTNHMIINNIFNSDNNEINSFETTQETETMTKCNLHVYWSVLGKKQRERQIFTFFQLQWSSLTPFHVYWSVLSKKQTQRQMKINPN